MSFVGLGVSGGSPGLLKPTSGGWPHVTIGYTGNKLPLGDVKVAANRALNEWAMKDLILERAYIHSFWHEREQKQRFDVLMEVKEKEAICRTRDRILVKAHPHLKLDLTVPHVTHASFWTEEEARNCYNGIRHLFPTRVRVTGVMIK